ncbi:hypothetical protein BJ912DRAFT_811805, partial [Pholiota molesta]
LQTQCVVVQTLCGLSGWGWVTFDIWLLPPDELWDSYIAAHPEAAIFHSKPFPLYNDIMSLIEGRFATGSQAFHVGE